MEYYRGFLIAEAYQTQPLNFIETPWPAGVKYLDSHFFEPGTIFYLPGTANERFLPEQHRFVMLHAYRFSPTRDNNSLISLGFCAEREMLPMLTVKGSTRGKSTDAFIRKNIHRCVNPYRQDLFGQFSVLAIDNGLEIGNVFVPMVDVEIVMSRRERRSDQSFIPPNDDGSYDDELELAMLWSQFRCDRRLAWSPTTDPISVHPGSLWVRFWAGVGRTDVFL